MKKIIAILLVLVCSLFITSCKKSDQAHGGNLDDIVKSKTLVVGTNAEYAPFEYLDADNNAVGYDMDIMDLVKKKIEDKYDIKLNLVVKDMAFDGLIGSMNAGNIDVIAAAMTVTDERKETLSFTNIYYQAKTVVVVKDSNTSITDYESLNGKKLGAQMGTVQVDFAKEASGFDDIQDLPSLTTLVSSLNIGNLDALVVEKPIALNILSKNSGFRIIDTIPFADDDGYGFATNKGNDALISLINEVISENQVINENGISNLEDMFVKALENSLAPTQAKKGLDFKPVFKYIKSFFKGAINTILFSIATIIIGSILGFMMCLARISDKKWLNMPAKAYISVVRGTPLLIQLYIFAFGIPTLFPGLNMGITMAGIIALGLNSTAYIAEIFRAGINSVDHGQTEAAKAMGFSNAFTMWKIVFPQAIKNIIPSIGNEFVTVVKESSVISIIGVYDITRVSDLVKASTLRVFETLIIAALFYFVLTYLLTKLIKYAEGKLMKYATK